MYSITSFPDGAAISLRRGQSGRRKSDVKDWFPFTSYDFYAYLTAGMVTLAAVDRVYLGSMLASEANWTIVNGTFWTAIAYLVGQIIAIPSSVFLEHLLGRKFRSEERSVGKECVSPCRSRGSPLHKKKNYKTYISSTSD